MNIIKLSPQNYSILVLVVAGLVWLMLWLVLLIDIRSKTQSAWAKLFWAIVATVPLLGGVFYSVKELLQADWLTSIGMRGHRGEHKLPAKG